MQYSDFLSYRKQYDEQKRLESIVQNRTLVRPKTSWLHVTLYSLLVIGIGVLLALPFRFIKVHWGYKLAIGFFVYFSYVDLSLRFLSIKGVECYQHYAKAETRKRCLCIPSCSQYAILALKKHCLLKAWLKIRKRLLKTCKGELYLIDYP